MLIVLTTNFNNEAYIERCLQSIQNQQVTDWRCYVMDDLSEDGSKDIIRRFTDDRFVFIENSTKQYQLGNYHQILSGQKVSDEDICVAVDGDDWLPDVDVFKRVVEAYSDGSTWMTWGDYVSTDGTHYNPTEIGDIFTFRHWKTPLHLRTWKAFLWRKIRVEDMQDDRGEFFRVAGDLAFLFPMIEMAGRHARYLDSINYCYNVDNRLSNRFLRPEEQRRNDWTIRHRKPLYVPKIFV